MTQSRYARQIRFGRIGADGQARLQQSRVAVIGLGALGSVIAQHLTRSGVGYVRIVDRDIVEWSNLQRQMLYSEDDASGMLPKAEAAAMRLRAMNSTVTVEPHVSDLTAANADALLGEVDLIMDGTDNFTVRYLINDYSVKHDIPWIYGGAVGAAGMTMSVLPQTTPCYRCLFPHAPAPGAADTCETAGVIAPIIDMIGSLQSTEALKLLSGNRDALHGSLLQLDLWNSGWMPMSLKNARRDDCPACGMRRFDYLDDLTPVPIAAALCGRESVHLTPGSHVSLNLDGIANQLSAAYPVTQNRFLLRAELPGPLSFLLFPDGRAILQGTEDVTRARSIYSELLGI